MYKKCNLIFILLLFESTLFAAHFYVESTTGPGIPESDLLTTTELIRVAVQEKNKNQLTEERTKADFVLKSKLLKLGTSYILTLEKFKGNEVIDSGQLKAAHIDELDKVSLRLTRSVLEKQKPTQEVRVGEVTEAEVHEGTERKQAIKGYYFGFGPASLGNLNSSGIGYDFSGAYAWDINPVLLKIFIDWGIKENANFFNIGLGGQYFLTDRDIAPFISSDFGFGTSKTQADSLFKGETAGGFCLGVGGGVQFLRTASVHIELGARLAILLSKNAIGNPTLLGLKLGFYF